MNLGGKIKEIRKQKRLTIADVAVQTGLSNGYISNVERNLNSPTIESLRKIVEALSITLVELFQDQQKNSRIVRKNERITMMKANDQSIFYELLSPAGKKEMGAVLVTLKPGAASGTEAHSHRGEEFGFVIKGSLLYQIGNETYELAEGDSIYYDASIPHFYKNIGTSDCISIWVVTPPTFS
ncbi:MAG: cupin domain-containing protein [Bacillus sp. (in: firmicutes)]